MIDMNSIKNETDNLQQVELMPGFRCKFYFKNTSQESIVQILTGPNKRSNFVRVLDIISRKTRIINLDRVSKIQIDMKEAI